MNREQENTGKEKDDKHLLASSEPHQQEELDQAEDASAGSFTLEPAKGIESDEHPTKTNIKQAKDDKQ
jgi:hypothetical protein